MGRKQRNRERAAGMRKQPQQSKKVIVEAKRQELLAMQQELNRLVLP